MASMVGGFLVLRHARIRTEIQDSARRRAIAEAELAVLNQPARGQPVRVFDKTLSGVKEELVRKPDENKEHEARIMSLNALIDEERVLYAILDARVGRMPRMFFWWGMMMIAGVLVPAWFIAFPPRLPPGNWVAYLVWVDYLAVVLMMFLTVWAALEPLTGPLPKRRTRAPAPGFRKDPRVF